MKYFILNIKESKRNDIEIFYRLLENIDKNNIEKVTIKYRDYIYIILNNEEIKKNIQNLQQKYRLEIIEVDKTFYGKPVKCLYISYPTEFKKEIIKYLKKLNIKIFEHDVSLVKKFEIDKDIRPFGIYELNNKFNDLENVKYVDSRYNPKVFAIDIEVYSNFTFADYHKDPIISIALYSKDKKIVFMYVKDIRKKRKFKDFEIYVYPSEKDMLINFFKFLQEEKPDILIGFNSHFFDILYILKRCKILGISCKLDPYGIDILKKNRDTLIYFHAIQHIDILFFIRNLFSGQIKTETLDLNSISKEILGESKIDVEFKTLFKWWKEKENIEKIAEYNIQDAKITYLLFNHFKEIIFELSKITLKAPQSMVTSTYGSLVESYLIRQIKKLGEIIPNKPSFKEIEIRKKISYKGAYVYEPSPGLYKNIAVLDFRSLYPSIIIDHNISFDTLCCNHEECKSKNSILIETNLGKKEIWFCTKKEGILPKILKKLYIKRAELKKRLKDLPKDSDEYKIIYARQYVYKILLNSTYGYLGFPSSRWYSLECAAAITAYGRQYILKLIDLAKKYNLKVIYSDTDSIFVLYSKKEDVFKFLDYVNNNIFKGFLELELEDFYKTGLFVAKRSKKLEGAKKKYALINEKGELKLRGFETVRRDWSILAKEVQSTILNMILNEKSKKEIIAYLQKVITDLKQRKIPLEKLIIREKLRKDLDKYKSEGPHVYAAKRYKEKGYPVKEGSIIEYIISKYGEKIRDKVRLPSECKPEDYDVEYYIHHQIFPAIEQIIETVGISKEEILGNQKKLLDFFK